MKRKGFTLIELLAVILVLGIIALIAVPTVSKIIVQAKKGAFQASIGNIVKAVEQQCQKDILDDKELTTLYTFDEDSSNPSINVKGNLPTYGTIRVDGKCNARFNLSDGKLTAKRKYNQEDSNVVDGNEARRDVWDGTTISTNLEGKGTEDNPYIIDSAADLVYMRNAVNAGGTITGVTNGVLNSFNVNAATARYKQTVDIELNDSREYRSWNQDTENMNIWIPIGTETNMFYGGYDGNNHTIAGLYMNSTTTGNGLFGYFGNFPISPPPTIKNIELTQSYIYGSSNTGSLVSRVELIANASNIIISNCSSDIDIKSSDAIDINGSDNSIGGLIGITNAPNNNTAPLQLNNLSYYGNLVNASYELGIINTVGGIIGKVNNTLIAIYDVSNFGKIKGKTFIGGLIGYAENSNLIIQTSYNKGDIIGKFIIGGLVGSIGNSNLVFSNTYNTGNITSTEPEDYYYSANMGGLVGEIYGSDTILTIGNSYNTGNVVSPGEYTGGLVGRISNINSVQLYNIYNTGNITGLSYTGGLFGLLQSANNASSPFNISEMYNTGNVTGNYYVGGIIGYYNSKIGSTISKIYNTGNITTKNATGNPYTGGLIGYAVSNASLSIDNVYNTGKISEIAENGGYEMYGIGGLLGCATSYEEVVNITSSYNSGDIEAKVTRSAGLVGDIAYNNVTIDKCYNAGNITIDNYTSSGITASGLANGQAYAITNSYNVGNITLNSSKNYNYLSGIDSLSSVSTLNNVHNSGMIVNTNTNVINRISSLTLYVPTTSTSNSYLSTTAPTGIYYDDSDNGVTAISNLDSMPTVISVINGDSKFKADTNNINGGYPILNWQ